MDAYLQLMRPANVPGGEGEEGEREVLTCLTCSAGGARGSMDVAP